MNDSSKTVPGAEEDRLASSRNEHDLDLIYPPACDPLANAVYGLGTHTLFNVPPVAIQHYSTFSYNQ